MNREQLLTVAKPTLFNTEAVRAILGNRKTVARWAIKPRYRDDEYGFQLLTTRSGEFIRVEKVDENECGIFADGTQRYVYPPYQAGDILYVRETYYCHNCAESPCIMDDYSDCNGCTHTDDGYCYCYKASHEYDVNVKWRPSIHMPKEAARIFLRVTNVRVERLRDITEGQIAHEGLSDDFDGETFYPMGYFFKNLWDSTIKKKDLDCYGWEANPWVWVVEFERI